MGAQILWSRLINLNLQKNQETNDETRMRQSFLCSISTIQRFFYDYFVVGRVNSKDIWLIFYRWNFHRWVHFEKKCFLFRRDSLFWRVEESSQTGPTNRDVFLWQPGAAASDRIIKCHLAIKRNPFGCWHSVLWEACIHTHSDCTHPSISQAKT